MLSCLVPPRFGQEDSIMPSSAKFALQFPALASGLPKDDESSGTPQTDCFLQCPQCHQTVQGFQALKDHIAAVHPAIKQEHGSATPSPPLSAFYHHSQQQQSQFQPIGASLPSPPASASALESNDPPSLNGTTTEPNGRSSSSNSNRSNSSSSSRSTSAGGTLADEGGRSISPTYSNSSHGAEPYACLQCSASFPNRDLLEKHELLHVPNALVSCKVCHKQFANVYRLQRHMISHDESTLLRKFKCTDCDKAFKFKHHLKEHVRIHSGEKPFACTNCGKRFSHSGSYSSHMTSKKCISLGLKVPTNNNNNNSSAVSNNNHSPKSGEKSSSRRSGSGYLPGGSPAAAGLSNGQLASGQHSPNAFLPMLPKYPHNYEAMNAAFLASFQNPFYSMAALNPGNPAFNPYSIQRLLELSAAGAAAAPPGAESMESLLLKTQQQLQASGDRKSPHSDAEDMIEEIVDNDDEEEEEEEPKLVMDVDDPEEDDDEDDRKDIKVDDDEDEDEEEARREDHRSAQNSPVAGDKTPNEYRNILDDMTQKILDVAHRISAGGSPLVEDIKTERPESTSPELNIDNDRRSPSPVAEQRPVEIKRERREDEDMKESEQPKEEAPLLQCQQCRATFNHQTELVQHEQVLCQSLMYHHHQAAAANYLPMSQSGSEDDCDFDGQKSTPSERSGKVRVRTAISEEQQNELKKYYSLNNKPNREEFQLIAKRVGMEARVVQVWFQNNRSRERKMGGIGSSGVPPPSPAPAVAPPSQSSEAEQPLDLSIRKSDSSPSSSPHYGTAPQSQSESASVTAAAALLDEAMNLSLKSQSRSSTPYKGFYPYPPALIRQTPSPNEQQLRAPPMPAGYPTAPTAPVSFVGMDRLLQQFSPEMARSAPIRADSLSPGSEKLAWPASAAAYDEQKLQLQMQSMLTVPKRVLYSTANVAVNPSAVGIGLGKELPDAEGQYVCDQCDKAFSKHSSLQRHKYEHSGQRPYKCLECPKAFKHKHHLTEHKRLHSGEKPFQCCKCLKRFSHSGSYSQHMNHRYSYCKPYRDGK